MGVVVEAYHELLDQRVAVKLLYQDVADREAQSRLLLEARSAAKLQSEHVARVVDVDVGPNGLPFIVMELLQGGDLCQLVDSRGALPRWMVVDYILQALEGLAHAHGRGIIHRDLKPSNLFLAQKPDGTQIVKILDFGISKSQGDNQQKLTGGGGVLGSPPYMSPEQVRAPKTIDHRTDIWSLGVCMYELLTNSMPFGGDEIQETFAQILERQPIAITQLVDGVPHELEAVVMRCLSKKREERYTDVGELARALAPFGSGAWIQSPDRIQATLARALMEDISSSSGTRLRGPNGPNSTGRVAVTGPGSSPGVRSSQPISAPGLRSAPRMDEMYGTANTVVVGFQPKRKWMAAVIGLSAMLAAVGLGLVGFTVMKSRNAMVPDPATATESIPTTDPAVVAPTVTDAPAPTAPPAPPAGSVIGVSSPIMTAPVDTGVPAAVAKPSGRPARPAAPAPPPHTATSKPPPPAPNNGSGHALPAGLPATRQ